MAAWTTFGGSVRGFGLVSAAPGTQTATDSAAHATAVQWDGKIVAAGTAFNAAGNRDFALARFNADGSPDTSFGCLGNGSVLLDFGGGDDVITAVTLVSGEVQEVLAAGYATIGGRREFALALFQPDGSLDTSFGNNGTVTLAVGTGAATITAVTLDPDGNIVVAGTALQNGRQVFALARFLVDAQFPGSLDPSFGNNGVVLTDLGANATAQGLTLQPDGSIVVAGTVGSGSSADVALARYQFDGASTPHSAAAALCRPMSAAQTSAAALPSSPTAAFSSAVRRRRRRPQAPLSSATRATVTLTRRSAPAATAWSCSATSAAIRAPWPCWWNRSAPATTAL